MIKCHWRLSVKLDVIYNFLGQDYIEFGNHNDVCAELRKHFVFLHHFYINEIKVKGFDIDRYLQFFVPYTGILVPYNCNPVIIWSLISHPLLLTDVWLSSFGDRTLQSMIFFFFRERGLINDWYYVLNISSYTLCCTHSAQRCLSSTF